MDILVIVVAVGAVCYFTIPSFKAKVQHAFAVVKNAVASKFGK